MIGYVTLGTNDMAKAAAFYDALASGGTVLLSGLLGTQAPAVVDAYVRLGFQEAGRIEQEDWSVLLLGHG